MLTLAQQQLGNLQQALDVPDPNPLPEPSGLAVALFEQPLLPAAVLGLVGVLLLAWLWSRAENAKARTRAALLGGGLILLAGAWYATGELVTTPRERVDAAARTLVRSVAKGDVAAVDAGLAPEAMLYSFLTPSGADEARILALVDQRFGPKGQYKVTGLTIERVEKHVAPAVQGGGTPRTAQVQIKVRVSAQGAELPNRSWWRLDMVEQADGAWQTTAIMPLAIQWVRDASGQ